MDAPVENTTITLRESSLGVIHTQAARELQATKRSRRSFRQIRTENLFRRSLTLMGLIMVVLVLGIMLTLIVESLPSIKALGISYLWGKTWDPVRDIYGAYPFLIGTLLTSFLALLISIPFSISVAIFLGEYYPKGWLANLLKNTI
jgi:phosphate transport system permease protein